MKLFLVSLVWKPIRVVSRPFFFVFLILVCRPESRAQTPVDISFPSQGHSVKGRFFPGTSSTNRITVILLPGFPGNEKDVLGLGTALSGSGFNVLVFNYSGSHRSEGVFGFESVLSDIKSAFNYLHAPDQLARFGIDSTKLVLGGYSFGGGMALTYAASHPEVQRVFSIAGTDHGEFAREYRRNQAMASQLDSMFEQLKRPNGPINFDGKGALKRLADDPSPYDLRLAAPKLADRDILLVGGWDDLNVSIENLLLPVYRVLKKANAVKVKFIALQSDHSFRNVRNELATNLIQWIQSADADDRK